MQEAVDREVREDRAVHRQDVHRVAVDSPDSFVPSDIDRMLVADGSRRAVVADNFLAAVVHNLSVAVAPHSDRTCSGLGHLEAADTRQLAVVEVAHLRALMQPLAERPMAVRFAISELDFAFDNWLEYARL